MFGQEGKLWREGEKENIDGVVGLVSWLISPPSACVRVGGDER